MNIRSKEQKEISSWENEGGHLSNLSENGLLRNNLGGEKLMIESSKTENTESRAKSFPKRMNSTQANENKKKKIGLLDREMGSLRFNFNKVKRSLFFLISYIKSFFTRKKVDEIRSVFSYKDNKKKASPHNGIKPKNLN